MQEKTLLTLCKVKTPVKIEKGEELPVASLLVTSRGKIFLLPILHYCTFTFHYSLLTFHQQLETGNW